MQTSARVALVAVGMAMASLSACTARPLPADTVSGPVSPPSVAVRSATTPPVRSLTPAADPHPAVPAQGPRPSESSPDASARPGADFNGDGYADLAVAKSVSVEGDTFGTGRGLVQVLHGSPRGFTPTGSQQWARLDIGGATKPDAFGRSLSYGDFDGDSFADLVVSDPGVSDERFGQGDVTVLYGSPNSLSLARTQTWSLDSPGIRGRAAEGDGFGHAVTSGDFDGDGRDDLAIGVPGRGGSGAVLVLYGQRDGLSAKGAQTWSRKSAGLQGGGLTTDADFGRSLVAGDFDGDHRDELAVGAPYNTVERHEGAGSLYVLRGGDDGLTSAGVQHWTAGRGGLQGQPSEIGGFGQVLAVGSFSGSGHLDLAVGCPAWSSIDTGGAGAVHVLYGSDRGLTAAGNQLWTQYELGTRQIAENGDPPEDSPRFGAALVVADFGRGAADDLVIGVPEANPSGGASGAVEVLYGSRSGLTAAGSRQLSQSSPGIKGFDFNESLFGTSLSALPATTSQEYATLVVGAPWYGGEDDAARFGILQLIRGSELGLTASGDKIVAASSYPQRPVGEEFGSAVTS